jgi:hypothetical protein
MRIWSIGLWLFLIMSLGAISLPHFWAEKKGVNLHIDKSSAPTSPAPWNTMVWSDILLLVTRRAASRPATATAAVPEGGLGGQSDIYDLDLQVWAFLKWVTTAVRECQFALYVACSNSKQIYRDRELERKYGLD